MQFITFTNLHTLCDDMSLDLNVVKEGRQSDVTILKHAVVMSDIKHFKGYVLRVLNNI